MMWKYLFVLLLMSVTLYKRPEEIAVYMLSHYKGPEPEKVGLKSFEFNNTCEW